MTSKQGYGPDLRKFIDKRVLVKLNGSRKVMGQLIGFDHFMNIVLNDAVEYSGWGPKETEKPIGKAMIRGNSIYMWECLDKIH